MTTSHHLLAHTDPQGAPKSQRVLQGTRAHGVARTNHLPLRRDLTNEVRAPEMVKP